METPPDSERHARLQDLASKSWNLELIISGAAVFLVSLLPAAVDDALRFYLEQLAVDISLEKISLPLLAYSFAKMVSWLLIGTFVVHFVLRAFWVGLVGLHAVYPEGIRYDALPWQSEISRDLARRKFGLLADYITRLDRLCNLVFSFAFLIALLSLGISLIYIVIFLIMTLPALTAGSVGAARRWTMMLMFVFIGLATLPALMQWVARHPRWMRWSPVRRFTENVLQYAPMVLMPLVYYPMSYINMTFTSNLPVRRLVVTMVGVMGVVLCGVFWVYIQVNQELAGRAPWSSQAFFARGVNEHSLTARQYDNLRPAADHLPPVSVPADMVDGPFLRVFVAYPKWLDQSLERFCPAPAPQEALPKSVQRQQADSLNLRCMSRFFQVRVNDSLYQNQEWLFYRRPETGARGLVTYLPTAGFSIGKNVLSVRIPSPEAADSLQVYGAVPFWFSR